MANITPMKSNKSDRTLLAVGAIVAAVLALSLGDAVIKLFSVTFPLWQIFVLRSALVVPVVVGMIWFQKRPASRMPIDLFWPINPFWVLIRSLLLTAMWIAYYSALPFVNLSVAAAAYYTSPLIITLLATFLSGDKAGIVLWIAVSLGFVGVLIMLQPGTDSLNVTAVLPLFAALLYALAMILTRTHCAEENPLILSLILNLTFIVTGLVVTLGLSVVPLSQDLIAINPFLFGPWTNLGLTEWFAIGALALAILVGSIGAAIAYQSGPGPVVATFDYAYLVFAGIWGLLFFAEWPDTTAVLGMIMIVCGGVLAVNASRFRKA